MIPHYRRHFAVLIFLLLASPLLVGFTIPESAQEILKEARTRSPAPHVPRSVDDLAAWPKQADGYLKDRFGLRKEMIRLHAYLAKRLFGEGGPQVLIGLHDRMFYIGEEAVRESAGLMRRDAGVAATADFLVTMRDALKQRGIRFLVASPPNTATIYQDDLPPWARNKGRITEYDLFVADLTARKVQVVDLRPILLTVRNNKVPAFALYDSHWTPRAAIASFNAITEADGRPEWRIDPDAALAPLSQRQGGDLARMIGVNDHVTEPIQEIAPPPMSKVTLTTGSMGMGTYVATGDRQGATVMIIGDSFTYNVAPVLLMHIGRVVWLHHQSCGFDWKLIDRFRPDEVWWMPTERLILCDANVHPDGFPGAEKTVTH
jgi:alginate O-acetyltransferase complex protein AlgJ